MNKPALDPKVHGDMECKAQQILIDIYNEDASNIATKSMAEVVARANKVISKVEDARELTTIHIELAMQTHKGALVLTLNSKEATCHGRSPRHHAKTRNHKF